MLFWPCSIEVTLSFKLLWCSISTQDTTVASGLSEPRSTKSTFCGYGKELTSVCYPFHDVKCSCYLKNYCINVTRSYSSVFPPWVYWKSLQTIFFFLVTKIIFSSLAEKIWFFLQLKTQILLILISISYLRFLASPATGRGEWTILVHTPWLKC